MHPCEQYTHLSKESIELLSHIEYVAHARCLLISLSIICWLGWKFTLMLMQLITWSNLCSSYWLIFKVCMQYLAQKSWRMSVSSNSIILLHSYKTRDWSINTRRPLVLRDLNMGYGTIWGYSIVSLSFSASISASVVILPMQAGTSHPGTLPCTQYSAVVDVLS